MQGKTAGISKIHLLLMALALFALLLLLVAGSRFSALEDAGQWRINTYQALLETRGCDKALFDMEGGVRGFLQAGTERAYKPYSWGKRAFSTHYRQVLSLTRQDPSQPKRLQTLKKQFENWLGVTIPILVLRRSSGAARAQQAARRLASRREAAMKAMRATLFDIDKTENLLLAQRTQEQAATRAGARTALSIASLMTLITAGLAAFALARGSHSSSDAALSAPQPGAMFQPVAPQPATPRKSLFSRAAPAPAKTAGQSFELHHHNQQMLDSTSEGIVAFNLRGRVTFANPAALRMTGREMQEVIGKPVDAVLQRSEPEETLASLSSLRTQPISALLQDERVHNEADEMFSRKDGSRFPVEYTITPLREEGAPIPVEVDGTSGGVDGAVVVFRDIAERKRAEVALLRLASIVESSRDAILSHTLDGRIVSWNAAAAKLYGYSAQEAEGRLLSILFPPNSGEELEYLRVKIENGERVEPYQTVILTKDGTPVEVALTLYPVRDAQGRVMGASSNARPIARRRTEGLPAFSGSNATINLPEAARDGMAT